MFDFIFAENNAFIAMPAIPRLLVALTEWAGVAVIVMQSQKRFSSRTTALLMFFSLLIQVWLRCAYVDDMPMSLFAFSMVLNLVFMLLCIFLMCRMRLMAAVFWWAFAFVGAEFSASLIWQLCSMIYTAPSLLDPPALVTAVSLVAMISMGFCHILGIVNDKDSDQNWKAVLQAVLIALLSFMASNINVFRMSIWVNSSNAYLLSTIGWVRTLTDFGGFVLLILLLSTYREKSMTRDLAIINEMIDAQYRQYTEFRESCQYISQHCHDLKHQLTALRTSCTAEEREAYLSEMEEMITRYNIQSNTGNPVLDTIINQKHLYCNQHNIQFSYNADGKKLNTLEVRDICIIIGNLLDNAVECVSQLEKPEERQIIMDVHTKNQFIGITVENCCHHVPVIRDNLPVTTKRDQTQHGYGLKSVAYTVEKYNGSFQFQAKDGWFLISILIPIDPQKQ